MRMGFSPVRLKAKSGMAQMKFLFLLCIQYREAYRGTDIIGIAKGVP
jgi:hypothetical protein